ncbi:hypothetical protein NST28_23000 [Paenibacillus sp. FSL R10-2791]|jgi:hypothetical protein|uniref:hypothetical protein n=1 Tax=unclassified Paenibacillus TaxID=185978 RepID=UPI0030F87B58
MVIRLTKVKGSTINNGRALNSLSIRRKRITSMNIQSLITPSTSMLCEHFPDSTESYEQLEESALVGGF